MAASADSLKLWYGVLGTKVVSSVTLPRSATVVDLRDAIADAINFDEHVASSHELELYMPRDLQHFNAELKTHTLAFLREGRLPESDGGFKPMHLVRTLDDPDHFGATTPLRPYEIHVLAKHRQPDDPAAGILWREAPVNTLHWRYADGAFPRVSVADDNDRLVTLPSDFLVGSGVSSPQADASSLVLYQRQGVQDAWDAIQRCTLEGDASLVLVGPRGCGKTCTAFAFACSRVDRAAWKVVWIHASPVDDRFLLVLWDENGKATATADLDESDAIAVMLKTLAVAPRGSKKKKILVFLDECVAAEDGCSEVRDMLYAWHARFPDRRRFVCVATQATVAEWNDEARGRVIKRRRGGRENIRERKLFGLTWWTLSEYVAAVRSRPFAATVETILREQVDDTMTPSDTDTDTDTGTDTDTPMVDLVCRKYGVVGGNARHMFCFTTARALYWLRKAIAYVTCPEALLASATGVGATSTLIDHVRSTTCRNGFVPRIVSLYSAREIAMKMAKFDWSWVDEVATACGFHPRCLDTELVDNWLCMALVTLGVNYRRYDVVTQVVDRTTHVWHAQSVQCVDLRSQGSRPFQLGWHVPVDAQYAGFDVVHWSVTRTDSGTLPVAHCQVVVAIPRDTHAYTYDADRLRLGPLLTPFSARSHRLDSVELCFVVPRSTASAFDIMPQDVTRRVREMLDAMELGTVTTRVSVVVV